MFGTGRLLRSGVLAAGLGLAAGCAPGYGPGVAVGVSPGAGLDVRSGACTLLGAPTPQSGHLALSSMSGFAGMRNRINALIAEFALGARSTPGLPSAAWKRAATGEC